MTSLDIGQLPGSLEEVEALILQLYQPGAAEKVAGIQETLQKLQRSPEGWQLADSLLGNKEESVRFFGALTFIVKLNTDSKSLSDDDARALLQNIIGWLIRCLRNGEGALVVRKLCSTLVTYFLQFSTSWTNCVKHLMYCVCIEQPSPYGTLGDAPETAVLVQNMLNEKAIAILWFASTLVEEVGKMDSNSMKQHKFHQQMVPNVDEIVPLIAKYIANDATRGDVKVRQEAMRCFQAYVSYSHRAFIDDEIVLDPLRKLTKPAIMCLVDENLYEIAVELFADVLANYSRFLHKDDFSLFYSLFSSEWAHERYERLVRGDYDFDSIQFGLFMLAFGDATVQDLTQKAGADIQCQQLLSGLCGLLGAEGFAVNEDKIFVPALEFWNTYVEALIDFTYSADGGHPSWFSAAKEYVMQAIQKCLYKIQFPPQDIFNTWDSVDRTGFKDARRDVGDLLQQFHIIMGIPILNVFIDSTRQAILNGNWIGLEASMYCLAQYPDCIKDDEERDEYLHQIFDPSLFSLFTSSQIEVPVRTSQTFLTLLRGYSDYFERHTANLPAVLNISFAGTGSPALAKTASSTIVDLCSNCRNILVPELDAFLEQFGSMALSSLDGSIKERIMEGIASIIQAIEDDKSKIDPLDRLLSFIEADSEQCLRLLSLASSVLAQDVGNAPEVSNNYNMACDIGLTALRCLGSVGKGLLVPTDKPVDLEKTTTKSPFWTTGEGSIVQQRIIIMMNRIYDALRDRGDIVEAAYHVFRWGFRELEPGPFVFSADTVAQFLLKADSQTPRLGMVIGTACSLLSSHNTGHRIDGVADVLLNWIAQLLHNLGAPSNDPEIAQNAIDFLIRLIPKYLSNLLSHQPASLEYILMFSLKALTGSDPLPKIASADFWALFVGLPNQGPVLQESIDNILQQLGPLLAQALVYNISGNAARSELDKLSDPIKKLAVRQVRSKSWFEAALLSNTFPSDKVTTRDKNVFLQKIIGLRGARGTNQVVRDFWLACRGSNFAYAS